MLCVSCSTLVNSRLGGNANSSAHLLLLAGNREVCFCRLVSALNVFSVCVYAKGVPLNRGFGIDTETSSPICSSGGVTEDPDCCVCCTVRSVGWTRNPRCSLLALQAPTHDLYCLQLPAARVCCMQSAACCCFVSWSLGSSSETV